MENRRNPNPFSELFHWQHPRINCVDPSLCNKSNNEQLSSENYLVLFLEQCRPTAPENIATEQKPKRFGMERKESKTMPLPIKQIIRYIATLRATCMSGYQFGSPAAILEINSNC